MSGQQDIFALKISMETEDPIKQVTLRMPKSLHKRVKDAAYDEETTIDLWLQRAAGIRLAMEEAPKLKGLRAQGELIDSALSASVPNSEQNPKAPPSGGHPQRIDATGRSGKTEQEPYSVRMEENSTGATIDVSGITYDDRIWIEKLIFILREKNPIAVPAVVSNLIAFESLTRAQGSSDAVPQYIAENAARVIEALKRIERDEEGDQDSPGGLRSRKGKSGRRVG